MHYFSGKGCFEFLESMHYCIGILSQQKRKEENQHKYMMGGIVHKYFPECYQFDEQELNRIIASGMKSEQCQRIIEIVKKESAEKRENAVVKAESEVAGDEGTGKSENA